MCSCFFFSFFLKKEKLLLGIAGVGREKRKRAEGVRAPGEEEATGGGDEKRGRREGEGGEGSGAAM